jgi:hypothetical protein
MVGEVINFEIIRLRQQKVLDDIKHILSGYNAVIGKGDQTIIYTSVPISTGKNLYNALKKHNYRSREEFKLKNIEAYYKEVRDVNVKSAIEFAEELRKQNKVVINPGDFDKQDWQDTTYMIYWEQVIDKYIDEIHFNQDYHYSTGCVEELLLGMVMDKKLFHRNGSELIVAEEIPKLWKAAEDITNVCNNEPKNLINFIMKIELYHRNKKSGSDN